jgi:putative membrane protein
VVFLLSFTTACQRNDDTRVEAARGGDAYSPATDNKMLAPQERETAMKIEQGHLGEIDLARLAKEKATDSDVKGYADMLEDEHAGALNDLQKLMSDNGVHESVKSKPAEGQEKLTKLQNMSGAAFDREYMNMMVMDHQKTLDELRAAQASVQNADFKDYINDLIPKVQKHLDEAKDVQTKTMSSH